MAPLELQLAMESRGALALLWDLLAHAMTSVGAAIRGLLGQSPVPTANVAEDAIEAEDASETLRAHVDELRDFDRELGLHVCMGGCGTLLRYADDRCRDCAAVHTLAAARWTDDRRREMDDLTRVFTRTSQASYGPGHSHGLQR